MVATGSAIELRLGTVKATILPDEGGALVALTVGDISPLLATPWTTAATSADPAPDEASWVRRWRGGWQLCFPSAGQPSAQDFAPGFHGAASQAPWSVRSRTDASVALEWADGVVAAERTWTLTATGARVETTAWALDAERNVVIAEHLILGSGVYGELGSVNARIDVEPESTLAFLDMDGAPSGSRAQWPGPTLEAWPVISDTTPARVAALVGVPHRRVRIVGIHATATVSWAGDAIPHALLWEELGSTQQSPWDGRVAAVGVEPTSAPHGLGTGRNDGLVTLRPGEPIRWAVSLDIAEGGHQ